MANKVEVQKKLLLDTEKRGKLMSIIENNGLFTLESGNMVKVKFYNSKDNLEAYVAMTATDNVLEWEYRQMLNNFFNFEISGETSFETNEVCFAQKTAFGEYKVSLKGKVKIY